MLYFSGKAKDILKYIELLKYSKGKTICCDIDNTLANTNKMLKQKGYDIDNYPVIGVNKDFWTDKKGIEILFYAEVIRPTAKMLKTFEQYGAKIVFATTRESVLDTLTKNWFRMNGILGDIQIHFVKSKNEVKADIYFEDNPEDIEQLLSAGKKVIIPTWKYNEGIDTDNTIHIYVQSDSYSYDCRRSVVVNE